MLDSAVPLRTDPTRPSLGQKSAKKVASVSWLERPSKPRALSFPKRLGINKELSWSLNIFTCKLNRSFNPNHSHPVKAMSHKTQNQPGLVLLWDKLKHRRASFQNSCFLCLMHHSAQQWAMGGAAAPSEAGRANFRSTGKEHNSKEVPEHPSHPWERTKR